MHEKFVRECLDDPTRFERPITRNKLLTFAKQCVTNRRAPQNSKEAELKCTSQLLGRLAFIAAKAEVDLEFLFTFPLPPVPLSMCKRDGSMVHTAKSALFDKLEKTVPDHGHPTDVKVHLIDGNFLLHCLPPNLPPTYGGLSWGILIAALSHQSKRIDIAFDTYEEPSIKDCERERRGAKEQRYVISGPDQIRPKNIEKALKSSSFKRGLPEFMMDDWAGEQYRHILEGRIVFLGVNGKCAKYSVVNGGVQKELIQDLFCNHPEADTRLCFHLTVADLDCQDGDIVVRASDTDILVILLHHVHRFTCTIWMEVGTSGKDNRRYVNVTNVAAQIGPDVCAALPGLHAFTGCDYTSAFARKGKKRPYDIMCAHDKFIRGFSSLSYKEPDDEMFAILEEIVCLMYGVKKTTTLNNYRFDVVNRTYNRKSNSMRPFDKLKSIEGSSIPPCSAELRPHSVRTGFVATMWGSSHLATIPKSPTAGWEIVDGHYRVIWFDGQQLPQVLVPEIPVEMDADGDPSRTDDLMIDSSSEGEARSDDDDDDDE